MTLVFVGAVSEARLRCLFDIANRIHSGPFEMRIDALGYWQHNRIAWAGCSDVPSGQRRLFDSLSEGLLAEGFQLDKRPFVPHVTLARKAHCSDLERLKTPIPWPVSEFALVESLMQPAEKQYVTLGIWSLVSENDKKC